MIQLSQLTSLVKAQFGLLIVNSHFPNIILSCHFITVCHMTISVLIVTLFPEYATIITFITCLHVTGCNTSYSEEILVNITSTG